MREDERQIIALLIADCLAAGHTVSVYDGEEWTVKRSKNEAAIMGALSTTDEDQLSIRDASGAQVAWFYLVYGNEPGVVISDCTDNPATEALAKRAEALGEKFNA